MWSLWLKLFAIRKLKEGIFYILERIINNFRDKAFLAAVTFAKQILPEVDNIAGLKGEDKKIEAWGRIKDHLGQHGMFLKDSTINEAIEAALGWLKDNGVIVREDE